jgi:hypothetical protein
MAEVEKRLTELGDQVEFPATPRLAERVGAELRADAPPRPARRRAPRLRLALLAALAVLLLAAAAAAAVPSTRHAVLEFLGLRGETIERVPKLPENLRAKPNWLLGRPTTIAAARPHLSFEPLLPGAVEGPNGVFLNYGVPRHSLNLTYPPQPGIPRSRLTGVGLLVNELNGNAGPGFYGKMVPRDARVERFGIDGNFAVWIEGLHAFFYKPAADHTFHIGHSRLAANALLVQRDEVMVRLEGRFTKARAVEIARSLRNASGEGDIAAAPP